MTRPACPLRALGAALVVSAASACANSEGPTAFGDGLSGDAALEGATWTPATDYGGAPLDSAPADVGADSWATANDAGPLPAAWNGDASGQDEVASLPTAIQGDLLISEVMFDPSGPIPESQWFEVYNDSDVPQLLSGLTLQDGYGQSHVIAASPPVTAPARSYVVLVRDWLNALATLVPLDSIVYEYGSGLPPDQGIVLASDSTGDLSLWNGNVLLADVPYGPWSLSGIGQSIELSAPQDPTAAAQQGAWCAAQNPWTTGSDWGTPGASNDCP